MTSFSIEAQLRLRDENCKHLRRERFLPGVVYGRNQEPISLKLNYSDFLRVFREAGESSIINLKIGKKNIDVLIHDFQKEPLTDEFIHVDFLAVTEGNKVRTKIELRFIGDSEAVKLGAILEELVKEIEIEALPKDLIDHLDVDLSLLKNPEDNIKVSDIKVPDNIKVLTSGNTVVAIAGKVKKSD